MTEPTPANDTLEVRAITAAGTLPLRLAVLLANRPVAMAQFPGDAAATTKHFGAFRNERLLGIASLFLAAMPERPGEPAVQLRGMATAPDARGAGIGRALALACIASARESGARLLWCNARTAVIGFYLKLGFEIIGGEFQIPDVGPHVRMVLRLADEDHA
jgi:GNAT superfamily N-acetyltransferase